MNRTTTMTPQDIHLGLYKRGETESRVEAQVVPRKGQLSDEDMCKEVRQLIVMGEFVFDENKAQNLSDTIELQCTTLEVEQLVRKELGKRAKLVRFMPVKVQEIRGQDQYGRR